MQDKDPNEIIPILKWAGFEDASYTGYSLPAPDLVEWHFVFYHKDTVIDAEIIHSRVKTALKGLIGLRHIAVRYESAHQPVDVTMSVWWLDVVMDAKPE